MWNRWTISGPLVLAILACCATAWAGVRLKEITDVEGERGNQLKGVGLVVGLNGTGGRSLFTQQVAVDMLQKLNITSMIVTQAKTDNVFKSDNVSVVMVTAMLPPWARTGSTIDVMVSTLDDADSLQGGTLVLAALDGVDGETYAVAQGPVSIGGFAFSGAAASVQKNHPTVGRIANGATVECEALGQVVCKGRIRLLLKQPDYATAEAIATAIDLKYPWSVTQVDGGTVQVRVPRKYAGNVVSFIGRIGLLEVTPDAPARVVINERTGTVVAGEHVKIATVAIAHGGLTVITGEEPQVSQPAPFSQGETVVVPRTQIDVQEKQGQLMVLERSSTVADLARALNALGVSPRDLIAIFQALKRAGALHAELEIM
jgi:flagellar P-ring protein precursor FlgI